MQFREVYHSEIAYRFEEEVPDEIAQGILYIIGEKKFHWCLIMKCPCGCGQTIQLNLLRRANPCWAFYVRKQRITVYPSIWREKGCRSHFIVRKNRIIMVREFYLKSYV
ncbi:MAG: DUF6527 family protein [Bacteroidia bacterium]